MAWRPGYRWTDLPCLPPWSGAEEKLCVYYRSLMYGYIKHGHSGKRSSTDGDLVQFERRRPRWTHLTGISSGGTGGETPVHRCYSDYSLIPPAWRQDSKLNKIRTIKIMKLCAISFKECWRMSRGGRRGGFPPMTAISLLTAYLVIVREPRRHPAADFAEVVPLRPIPARTPAAGGPAPSVLLGPHLAGGAAGRCTPGPGRLSLQGAGSCCRQTADRATAAPGENSQQTMNCDRWIMPLCWAV